jgi:hypothetical protein
MQIEAGGRTWIVDAHETTSNEHAATTSWEIRFTPPERVTEYVEMRWIPRPERLTERVARRLFELAGERLWRDPRSAVVYHIQLVDESGSDEDGDLAIGNMMARFGTASGAGMTRYELDRPLGLASDGELQAMADRALGRRRGIPA